MNVQYVCDTAETYIAYERETKCEIHNNSVSKPHQTKYGTVVAVLQKLYCTMGERVIQQNTQ